MSQSQIHESECVNTSALGRLFILVPDSGIVEVIHLPVLTPGQIFISICLYVDKLSVWELTKSTSLKGAHVCARPCTCLTPTSGLGKYCTVCS